MAHRVMLCLHFGLAARRETKKEGNEQLFDGVSQLFRTWSTEGIRLIGTFGNAAHTPGGFAHHAIFEIDSVETVGKMDGDFMKADWSHMVESFELHLGTEREFIDKHFS